ncbi:cAMP-regulated phosphoprotein 21 [Hoplias malabaricus]|uniref:cAMP-regulated phosphoprotein 21 n=1 Tax=Hoplias malabaricus TaxID=27720 RepID=UPI0034630437
MSDTEAGEKKSLPESIKGRETPPMCCVMEAKEENCLSNSCLEQQIIDANKRQPKKTPKSKRKLVRSVAVCEESSPTELISKCESENTSTTINDVSSELEEEEQGSNKEDNTRKKPSLSKEPSLEYTDSTGIDLEEFLITTLKSSPRDRLMLLKLEQDMTDFMTDNCSYRKFPQMSSYHRMLVHRVAAYFGLEHNVDHSGKSVIINKTSNSRIPEQRFAEHVQEEKAEERRSILKRDNSQEKEDIQLRGPSLKEQTKSKSIEEREEEYQRVRDRIFSQDSSCPLKSVYIETRGPEDSYMNSETQRKRQLFRNTRDGSGQLSGSRQSSVELECYWSDPRPWSSTDSDSSTWTTKPTHTRSDSSAKLCKPETMPSSCPLSGAQASNSPNYILVPPESSIIPGSILINPHTGQPYLNPDGTPAVYNPPASQQPVSSQLNTMQPQATPHPYQQQPVTGHGVPQVQYSSVTYIPTQQVVTTSQLHPPEQCREDLSTQFSHMTLSHQSSGDASDLPAYFLQGPPQTHCYSQTQHSYAPPLPVDSYNNSGMSLTPTALAPQTCSQQNTQTSVYSYPAQCLNTQLQYGPANYSTQTGYAALLTNQQQAYPSMVGTQVLPQTQQSIMGPYPSTSSYQMAAPLQSYPSTVLVTRQPQGSVPQGGASVYCSPLPSSPPPPPQTVSMLGVTCQSSSCRNACNRNQNQSWY